jgi:hypothetical protein
MVTVGALIVVSPDAPAFEAFNAPEAWQVHR